MGVPCCAVRDEKFRKISVSPSRETERDGQPPYPLWPVAMPEG